MWILLIAALLTMSAFTIYQTPREWFQKPILRIILIAYHGIGVVSILLLLWGVHLMEDGVLRRIIIWVETMYFTVTMYALVFALIRYLCFSIALRFHKRKMIQLLGSRTLFFSIVLLVSAIYLIPATHYASHLKTGTYDVAVDKVCSDKTVKAVLLADFHVGGGARHYELDQMVKLTNEANPDIILIAGDVADSSSSASDLEYMEASLKKLNSRYGTYYVEGNHERECNLDPEPYLERGNVTILKDEGICLPNGLNLVGRKDEQKESVASIMTDSGLASDMPTVVVQHNPKNLETLVGSCDVVLGGHTHGYAFPFLGLREPLLNTITCGYRNIGGTLNAVVTTGVSQWGYRGKWPSQSEVTVINMNFIGGNES